MVDGPIGGLPKMLDAVSRNVKFLGHSDQGNRGDGVQVIVERGHAFIGHMFSGGFTVVDVRDPRKPRPVRYVEAAANTWNLHLQAHGELLLVVNAVDLFAMFTNEDDYYTQSVGHAIGRPARDHSAGLQVFDIANPAAPREIGFMPVEGAGLHRIWYVGGRYAYVSALLDGYSDYILMIVDMADPTKPTEVGRWWIPGMWTAGGEQPSWDEGRRFALHHAIVADGIAFGSWRDGGLTLIDVSHPADPQLLSHTNWSPPFGGGTHTALPLSDRGLAVVADEAVADNCADGLKHTWIVDVREPRNPVTVATLPAPSEEDYCARGGHFGPHNLHENRPGSFVSSDLVFATYQNAGVRVFDISNAFRPEEVAYYVPPPPKRMVDTRPGRARVIQSCDVFVDTEGTMYVTDYNAGLYILEYGG